MSDITVIDQGSIVLLQPNTVRGASWLHDHIGQDNGFQPYWPTVIVEPQYVQDIIEGFTEEGLTVEEF